MEGRGRRNGLGELEEVEPMGEPVWGGGGDGSQLDLTPGPQPSLPYMDYSE